jgi:hypothetical protein
MGSAAVSDEQPWFSVEFMFAAGDLAEAEKLAEKALDVICGGEIGMGLHVCKRNDWIMLGPSEIEP